MRLSPLAALRRDRVQSGHRNCSWSDTMLIHTCNGNRIWEIVLQLITAICNIFFKIQEFSIPLLGFFPGINLLTMKIKFMVHHYKDSCQLGDGYTLL